jgi:hypothetical protein
MDRMASDPYAEYLARYAGSIGAGSFGKFRGRLVRKLAPDEFADANHEFSKLRQHYLKCIERGDTLNDTLLKMLQEKAAELVLEESLGPGQ